ncbi:DUF4199 domain-containing protein [Ulvibacter litoralis]|uniref:DUF4199 domain-containing protein n=1 Tax=Ulvibacter litoralis TaxID=227084 RepID=A0A1G7GTJ5_9FLAO|nr:DUF4199 domain-containing protein [Ulvibacter litoralis]GHC55107.1 hypothetical protein GCM10008083_19000 [Ulvibacter litoralis]SDE91498.1 Protein of unknown function [Ulvibacter litoralis]
MKKIAIEFKWAIIFTIMTLAWMLLEKTLGWHDEKIANHYWTTLLFLPIAIFMFVLAIREKRRRYYHKKITWKQAFYSGVVLSVFIAALSPLGQYITHNYITPKYFINVIDYSVTSKLMTIEAANEYFNITNYIMQVAIGTLLGGIATAAIVATFMKRE